LFYAIASSVLHFIGMIVTAVAAGNYPQNGLFAAAAVSKIYLAVFVNNLQQFLKMHVA